MELTHAGHVDGKKFRIKRIYAENGLIHIETKVGTTTTHTIKEIVERIDSINKANKKNMLKDEERSMAQITDWSIKAIAEAYKQLGNRTLPDSVKLYLATPNK